MPSNKKLDLRKATNEQKQQLRMYCVEYDYSITHAAANKIIKKKEKELRGSRYQSNLDGSITFSRWDDCFDKPKKRRSK